MALDNWAEFHFPAETYMNYYNELDHISKINPVEELLPNPPAKVIRTIVDDDGSLVSYIEEDEEYQQRRIFRPALQSQRNSFVLNALKEFFLKFGDIRTIAVMGCGAFSLERFIIHQVSEFGTGLILSVDICKKTMQSGLTSLKSSVNIVHSMLSESISRPTMLEQYQGDITLNDDRFSGIDCVCSVEVIEHMSLSEAESFVKNVLGFIQPKLFILSTPNHEYNLAWNGIGSFRHDDHKFEFTRHEFEQWINNLVQEYPFYDYTFHYVGNISGYEHLSGATQFVVMSRKADCLPQQFASVPRNYKKVGQVVVYGCFKGVSRWVCKNALKAYLEQNTLDETNLVQHPYGRTWEIDARDVLKHVVAPEVLTERITVDVMVDAIRNQMEGFVVCLKVGMRGSEACLIIPEATTIEKVKSLLNKEIPYFF